MGKVVEPDAEQIAYDGGEDEQCHIVARGLVVEEEADKEEIAVAPQTAGFADAPVGRQLRQFAARVLFTERYY